MLSGWNCTPMDRQFTVLQPHDQTVLGFRRDLQHVGQVFALDDQRMVAGGREWARAGPASTLSPEWLIMLILPCIGTGARITRPPKACPIA